MGGGPVFVSACQIAETDPYATAGDIYYLLVNDSRGAIFHKKIDVVWNLALFQYDEDRPGDGDPNLDVLGGMWTIAFAYDVFEHLKSLPFRMYFDVTGERLLTFSEVQACNIAYRDLNLYNRSHLQFDAWTGEPEVGELFEPQRLTQQAIDELKAWRNAFGAPWNTAVYDPDYSLVTQHYHSTRLAIAKMLWTPRAETVLQDALTRFAEEHYGLTLGEWSQRHVGDLTGRTLFEECFAWYTAPHYKPGSLPPEVEELLTRMAKGHPPGIEEYLDERNWVGEDEPVLRERLPDILASLARARQPLGAQAPDPEWLAGYDVRYFLDQMAWERQRAKRQ